jgi:triosephosphate isomerase (TIM)
MVRKLVAGNWKMNGLLSSVGELEALIAADVTTVICPPFTLVDRLAARAKGSKVSIGAQGCHKEPKGAYTGEVSAEMLADLGASYVIVGHSERRTYHLETDAQVAAKAAAAQAAGLNTIICVGETEAERDAGQTLVVVTRQIKGSIPPSATAAQTVIAYEPVWAIGTGRTPSLAEIADVHDALRALLLERFGAEGSNVPLQYGGSVKGSNAQEIAAVSNVDGALVGGASLKAAEFLPIVQAFNKS